jgi:hypothetical protein
MTEPVCAWCLEPTNAPACTCETRCGEAHCPYAEEFAAVTQPVPQFPGWLKAISEMVEAKKTPARASEDVVVDPRAALDRVLKLHSKCSCKSCSDPEGFGSCSGCNEHWPCPTVKAVTAR